MISMGGYVPCKQITDEMELSKAPGMDGIGTMHNFWIAGFWTALNLQAPDGNPARDNGHSMSQDEIDQSVYGECLIYPDWYFQDAAVAAYNQIAAEGR